MSQFVTQNVLGAASYVSEASAGQNNHSGEKSQESCER